MQTTDMTIEEAVLAITLPEKKAVEASEPEEQQAEAEEPETEEPEEEAAEGEEPQAVEDEEGEEADAQSKALATYTVKVDGKTEQVTLEALTRSYSGQAYIQKGMQEAASARKEAETLAQTLQSERQQFLATLSNIQQHGIMEAPKQPDISMINTDPIGYMQEKAKYDLKFQEYQNQQRQLAEESRRFTAQQEQALQAKVAEEAQKVVAAIPDFAVPEKAEKLYRNMVQAASKYGFSAEEVGQLTDARYVKLLHDLAKVSQIQAATETAKKKPEPPRNVKPGARRSEPPQSVREKAIKAATRSQNIDDFVALISK